MATNGNNDILRHLKLLFSKEEDTTYQLISDYLQAIVYVFDADKKKINFVNKNRLCDCLGYSLNEIKSWEDDIVNMVFKDDVDMVKRELEKYYLLQDDDDYSYSSRLNHKEGDWRYYRTRGTILRRNEEQKPVSLLFVAEDITEKIKHEEEINALKKLIDDTEDLLLFGSWDMDIKIDKVYWTDGMYKLLNYEKQNVASEVSQEFYMKHLSIEDASALQEIMTNAIKNKNNFEYKHPIITSTKEEKIVSTKGKTVTLGNGEVVKLIGITRDITKQTKINQDLFHYHEMIREKEEFLNQGSWETDIQSGEIIWSKGMYHLFGYDPEIDIERVKVSSELCLLNFSEEKNFQDQQDSQTILKGKDNYISETIITTKDGITRQLETYGKIIRNNKGIIEKIIGTTKDVTRLREYERSLEEKIQELNRFNTELEEFAYVASHDLQEPLRKLTTFSERLQLKFSETLGNEGKIYIDRIVAATENMRTLIENLLEYSGTARSVKYFTKADLNELLKEVKADLELKIEETSAEIIAHSLPTIEVIPSQIKQLFDNLLSNSIKFAKHGQKLSVTITSEQLTAREKKINSLPTEKNYFKIDIIDNGIGFEKEYEEKIFQIFQRLHGKAEYPGSGIGLAICKKIIENHNGVIFASGELNVGAVFTIILPENQS